jgi:hypothetical protein
MGTPGGLLKIEPSRSFGSLAIRVRILIHLFEGFVLVPMLHERFRSEPPGSPRCGHSLVAGSNLVRCRLLDFQITDDLPDTAAISFGKPPGVEVE